MSREVADAIRGGAAYIQEHGWCERGSTDAEGRVCLQVSILRAAELRTRVGAICEPALEAQQVMNMAVSKQFGVKQAALWNDAVAKTENEVVKFMLQVADEVEFDDA